MGTQVNRRHNVTAIIYDKRGRVLSVGRNSYVKTHPLQAKASKAVGDSIHKVYQHAEVNALVKLKDWSKAYEMMIDRRLKDGSPGLAKPCKACQWLIKQAGIKQVNYTL